MTFLRTLVLAVVTLAALASSALPAAAVNLPDPGVGRVLEQPVTRADVRANVRVLMHNYVGPAVADQPGRLHVAVWGCKVTGKWAGECSAKVTVGTVTCRGVFRARKAPRTFWTYPVRMTCAS